MSDESVPGSARHSSRFQEQWRHARIQPLESDVDSLSQYSTSTKSSARAVVVQENQEHVETPETSDLRVTTITVTNAENVPAVASTPNHLSARDGRTTSLTAESEREDEIPSRLSFIVKEKLHEFAKDIRRRTSEVREEIIRDLTPEPEEDVDNQSEKGQDDSSLLSLIGLHEQEVAEASGRYFGFIPKSVNPFSKSYMAWLCVVVLAFLYNAFAIPLRSTYPYQTDVNVMYWMMLDYTSDLVYLLDMGVVKPRMVFTRGGITIKDPKEMKKHYLISNTFKMDLVSLLPFDLGYIYTGPVAAWRLVRLGKLGSFWEFFDLLDSSFSNPYIVRITKTFSYMIYIIHCNSCVYYMLSAWQAFGQIAYRYKDRWYLNKWVYNNQGNAYIRCFYFTSAVATSTGNNPAPTNVIEYIYMTFSWMMGVFVFALLLGQIRDIVSNANKNNEEFRNIMDKALAECKRLELPEHLINRVRVWFMYTWEQQKTLDEKKLVEKLPLKLQTDLALSVHYNTLSKVQLFQDADRALLRDLVLKLKPVIFLPGDMICRKGDVGKEMYIVNQGILEVVGDANQVFATLKEGSVFGEISLLAIGGNNRRTANIRSKGYSTLFVLSKEDLNDVIRDYPDAQQLLKKKARKMLKKDEKKDDNNKDKAREELKDKCRVSADIRVPKFLQTVRQLLPKESQTKQELEKVFEKKTRDRRRLKRWSTIPCRFDGDKIPRIQRAKSLDARPEDEDPEEPHSSAQLPNPNANKFK
ncbi:unnamed protein product [Bursaphelenchus xylophilus]|uniref:(pine wood nematode) hypothetical protein n=1 Tax=Bursaphelenchus xylophilus TaxID=6326 RepID=A0A1I7SAA3_BURXY|nr:unnamed protein product [Bursaphelenchus xylophilus]CAG9084137.1 unnamed protein product [Bursaphelenchus xylophilus]